MESKTFETVYPDAIIQRCIIHQLRSSTKYVSYKDIKELMTDLKEIYKAPTRDNARISMDKFSEKWKGKYSHCVDSWNENWVELTAYFDMPEEIRKLIYTTNAIEGYHRKLRKVLKNRTIFPNDLALMKLLYLTTLDASKKWTSRFKDWGNILGQLKIIFPRISEYLE